MKIRQMKTAKIIVDYIENVKQYTLLCFNIIVQNKPNI